MTLAEFLGGCAEFERLMGDLYRALGLRYAEDAEAAELFCRLAEEEDNHERQIRLLRSLARTIEGEAQVHPRFEEGGSRFRRTVEQIRQMVATRPELSLEEATAFASRIEANALEAHRSALVTVPDEGFRKMLEDLGAGDERHRALIERFRTRRWPRG